MITGRETAGPLYLGGDGTPGQVAPVGTTILWEPLAALRLTAVEDIPRQQSCHPTGATCPGVPWKRSGGACGFSSGYHAPRKSSCWPIQLAAATLPNSAALAMKKSSRVCARLPVTMRMVSVTLRGPSPLRLSLDRKYRQRCDR